MSKTLCSLPWSSVAIRNDGYFRVCCHANVSEERGMLQNAFGTPMNAASETIEGARNSETLKQIRQEMLAGKWPSACARCQREEDAGLASKRIYANEVLGTKQGLSYFIQHTAEDGSITSQDFPIQDMDLRFGNKCNLKCRMCGPTDSSLWYEDFERLHGSAYKAPPTYDWYNNPGFWQELEANSQGLKHIYVVGGEPLLIDQHYEFLQDLVSKESAQNIILEYNTNLTVLPEKALELWKSFKQVRVGVSVDAAGVLNDYIRKPSRFATLERNLERLDATADNVVVWLAATVSLLNLAGLSDLMLWKIKKNFRKINMGVKKPLITHHVLHKPEFLNIQSLPESKKSEVSHLVARLFHKFERDLAELPLEEAKKNLYKTKWQEIYQGILRHMNARDLSSSYPEFLKYTLDLDQIRNESLQSVLSPDYHQLLTGEL